MKFNTPFALRHPLAFRQNKLARANAQWQQNSIRPNVSVELVDAVCSVIEVSNPTTLPSPLRRLHVALMGHLVAEPEQRSQRGLVMSIHSIVDVEHRLSASQEQAATTVERKGGHSL